MNSDNSSADRNPSPRGYSAQIAPPNQHLTQIAVGLGVQIPPYPSAIPSADELKKYKDFLGEDYLNRIVSIAEENAATERETKKNAQILQWKEGRLARTYGLIFGLSALGSILILAYWGQWQVAVAVAAAIAATTYTIVRRTQDPQDKPAPH